MSNKTIIQNHNSILNINNNDLVSILNTINNLPSAGSGEISLQEKTVTPSTSQQSITADLSYNGLSKVTVNAVTSAIDSDIKAANIKKGVNILGVTGTLEEGTDPVLQSKTISPSTSSQTVAPDSGYDGLSSVSISAVTSAIDSDIKASNIKKGVNILGVTGTLEEGITPSGTLNITSNGTYDVTNYSSASVNVANTVVDVMEPYIEETYDDNNELISANIVGHKVLRKNLFNGATMLTSVSMTNTVEIVKQNAFGGCRALATLVFPQSVTTVESQACSYAYGLKNIVFLGTPNSIAEDVFKNCTSTSINIYVPWSEGSVANAPWGCTGATIHYNHNGEI